MGVSWFPQMSLWGFARECDFYQYIFLFPVSGVVLANFAVASIMLHRCFCLFFGCASHFFVLVQVDTPCVRLCFLRCELIFSFYF